MIGMDVLLHDSDSDDDDETTAPTILTQDDEETEAEGTEDGSIVAQGEEVEALPRWMRYLPQNRNQRSVETQHLALDFEPSSGENSRLEAGKRKRSETMETVESCDYDGDQNEPRRKMRRVRFVEYVDSSAKTLQISGSASSSYCTDGVSVMFGEENRCRNGVEMSPRSERAPQKHAQQCVAEAAMLLELSVLEPKR